MNSTIGGKCGHLRRICGQIHLNCGHFPKSLAIWRETVANFARSVAIPFWEVNNLLQETSEVFGRDWLARFILYSYDFN